MRRPISMLLTFLLTVPVSVLAANGVQDYFGAFRCTGSDGSIRHAAFGPLDRDIRALTDPTSPLTFNWAIGGAPEPVVAVESSADALYIDGLPGGTLKLSLLRPKPTMDEDYEPFILIAEQTGRVFECGYNAP